MKLPMSWLKDYMNIDGIEPADYIHRMTMTGSKVEGIENPGAEIKNVVVGKIEKIEKHPDADKLVVCQVNVGEETIQIVTGAPNVFEGAVVPVAKHKSNLPGGVKITKGKLRGVESFGMMCSTDELGISQERAAGILILPEDTEIGADICDVLGLNENIVEFEITSNRPDCMSIIGLARESAVTYDRPFQIPEAVYHCAAEKTEDTASVTVEDAQLCPRYVAHTVKNVKIAPSPEWMQRRLQACGIRAINNVVDITNYIMLEYGQPMHAYDLDHVVGKHITVRRAKDGEMLETLDSQPRELDSSMIVIADDERAIGVAGVMGGANSEVTEKTSTVLFEAANFHPATIRRAAKKLGMRTEASALFEKGLDSENTMLAIERACQLMEELGAGEPLGGCIDVYGYHKPVVELPFEGEKMRTFLGMDIPDAEMRNILERLGFRLENDRIYAPSFRSDIECRADIAEEVARIYGYDNIPTTLMNSEVVVGGKTAEQKLEDTVKNAMTAAGYYEMTTYSFIDPKEYVMSGISEEDARFNFIRIQNPLGEENSVMRTAMLPSTMEILSINYRRRNPRAALFELDFVYTPVEGEKLPNEHRILSVGMYGNGDFYALKGALETVAAEIGLPKLKFVAEQGDASYHPGRCAKVYAGQELLGIMGQIHPKIARNYKIQTEVYAAELDFEAMVQLAHTEKHYTALPKFPAVTRDIAMVVDENVPVGDVEDIFDKHTAGIIESYTLFDVYRGLQIGKNKKSVAYSLTFRTADRTLTDEEVGTVMSAILEDLKEKLGADLRE